MTVASTSIAAYRDLQARDQLNPQQSRIVAHFALHPAPLTRAELAALISMKLQSVCGRVNELIEAGVLVEDPARKCGMGGRSAHPVRLAAKQRELFE